MSSVVESLNSIPVEEGDCEHVTQHTTTNNSSISENFTKKLWELIEKKLSEQEKNVLRELCKCSSNISSESKEIPITSFGDDIYRQYRSKLVISKQKKNICLTIGPEINIVQENQSKNGKKQNKQKQPTKAELIIQKNMTERLKNLIQTTLEALNSTTNTNICLTVAYNSEIVEIKGIGLLFACAWLENNIQLFNTEQHYSKVFNIIATTQQFIKICEISTTQFISKIDGKLINASAMLIEDLRRWVSRLRSRYVDCDNNSLYNWENIQKYAPEIFSTSEYHKALPRQFITLKPHQREIIDAVNNSVDTGAWIVYDAMIGSGKTTSIAGIASAVASLRKQNPTKYEKLRLLSVCNSNAVRLDMAQKLYNLAIEFPSHGIHFAISYLVSDSRGTHAKIVKNDLCKTDNDIVTIVASPEIATQIITENNLLPEENQYQYILFIDEPTMGADDPNSKSLYDNISLYMVAPSVTISSSATFPDTNLLKNITDHFFTKYPTANNIRVFSDEISIGCDIRTLSGEIVVPHLGVTTSAQLLNVITSVSACAFLGKTYTPSVVNDIYNKMLLENIAMPSIPERFLDSSNLKIQIVKNTAIELLNILVTQSDDVITRVCETSIQNNDQLSESEDDSESFSFKTDVTEQDNPLAPLEYSKFGTSQAYRLQGQTLIATSNPSNFVLENFRSLIDQIYESKIQKIVSGDIVESTYRSTGDAMRKYFAELADWEKKLKSIDKNATSPDDKRLKLEEHELIRPKFTFPSWGNINSAEHIMHYSSKHKDMVNKTLVRSKETLPYTDSELFGVDDRILTALFCGVGIYSPDTVSCKRYLNLVLELASAGLLAYVVADDSICFGTNYPFYNVVITEDFSRYHSMAVLFQVMGRAGRPGKSPKALIIVTDNVARRVIDFSTNLSELDFEARHMESMFLQQKEKEDVENQKRIEAQLALAYKTIENEQKLKLTKMSKQVILNTSNYPSTVPISSVPDRSNEIDNNVRTHQESSMKSDSTWKRVQPSRGQEPSRNSDSTWERTQPPRGPPREPSRNSSGWNNDAKQSSTGKYVPPAKRNTSNK